MAERTHVQPSAEGLLFCLDSKLFLLFGSRGSPTVPGAPYADAVKLK